MLRPSLKNVVLYLLLKSLLFYVIILVAGGNVDYSLPGNLKNVNEWFVQSWLLLPVLNMLLFTVPTYLVFKLSGICIVVAITAITIAEYFVYTLSITETHINMNGFYNGLLGTAVLLLFFYKYIRKRVVNP